jgi:hypothetical protein
MRWSDENHTYRAFAVVIVLCRVEKNLITDARYSSIAVAYERRK